MYELPHMDNVKKVVVDGAVVRGEAKPYLLLASNESSIEGTDGEDFKKAASDE